MMTGARLAPRSIVALMPQAAARSDTDAYRAQTESFSSAKNWSAP